MQEILGRGRNDTIYLSHLGQRHSKVKLRSMRECPDDKSGHGIIFRSVQIRFTVELEIGKKVKISLHVLLTLLYILNNSLSQLLESK